MLNKYHYYTRGISIGSTIFFTVHGVPNTQTDRQTPLTVGCMRYGLKDLAQTCWLSLVFLSKSLASDNMATTLHRRRSEGVNQVAAGRGQFRRNGDNQRF